MRRSAEQPDSEGWELTGNHYLAAPAIEPATGALHALNAVHRGWGGLLTWCAERVPRPGGAPLFRLRLGPADAELPLAPGRWERIDRWIPRWTAHAEGIEVACTICTPGGFDPLVRGGVLVVELHAGATAERIIEITLEGVWRWSLLGIVSERPVGWWNRLARGGARDDGLALEFGEGALSAALGVHAGPQATYRAGVGERLETLAAGSEVTAPNGTPIRFEATVPVRLRPGRRTTVAFTVGVAVERDGALATAAYLARRGAAELLRQARLDLARLARPAEDAALGALLNRNLLYAHYAGIARAVDDDRLYFMRSRSPEHGAPTPFNEREALFWLLPALTLADEGLAKEALLRAFEQYSHRPGERLRYLDGGVLAPGFCLDQVLGYPLALDRFVADARDESPLDEPIVQDVLREIDELLFQRLHSEVFLAGTELLPSGDAADYPFVSFGNALLRRFCDVLPRIWRARDGEPAPRFQKAGDEVAAAVWQRCTADVGGIRVLGYASDLRGGVAVYDDPAGSLRLLPYFEFCPEDDPILSDTMDLLHSREYPLWHGDAAFPGLSARSDPARASFAAVCTDLLTPRRAAALELLRRLPLRAGIASDAYDPQTGAPSAPYSAPLAGFLAWALAVHQTRERPAPRRRGQPA